LLFYYKLPYCSVATAAVAAAAASSAAAVAVAELDYHACYLLSTALHCYNCTANPSLYFSSSSILNLLILWYRVDS